MTQTDDSGEHEAFLHAPTQALQHHSERTVALEMEYLRRHPERDIDERRLWECLTPPRQRVRRATAPIGVAV